MASIGRLKSRLSDLIEPDFGLMDHLLRLEALDRRQYSDVLSKNGAAFRRSEAVLDNMKTKVHCGKLLEALLKSSQQHVANYITQNEGQKDDHFYAKLNHKL